MNKEMCKEFKSVREWISDELKDKESYEIKDDKFLNDYCDNKRCENDFDLISAGCLYLLDQFYSDSGVLPSPSKSNPYIVDYILIWLSYMLNLKKSEENIIDTFYNNYINTCGKYKTEKSEFNYHDHDNYKGLIDKRKEFLYMDRNIVTKFYEAFKSLCNLYNELDYEKKNCENYLDDNNEFFNKYEELKKNTSIADRSPYKEILFTLSTDYDDFKKECNSILSYLSAKTKEKPGQTLLDSSGQYVDSLGQGVDSFEQYVDNPDITSSSSSIVSKLIPVLLIFGAIAIFLGISYKYSLFGFRKRFQKQKLREKLKK
ncbi:PIR protein [Plasmodium yoelii]|uniref:PIR protein n=2 Tax=Plasmodium yoelii TaxID=5861 RepID=A0AAE9WLE7_PLAYO|nr:PIR protein [Plasmodium yoelii]WBY55870.1 PIR protein [Plasmodium yoelii yoelii]VTZ75106.1 PIR protein [Plasmodium yoelii]|eukprot:XP_022813105.1 PIR protein [Plasmodium yoelii]